MTLYQNHQHSQTEDESLTQRQDGLIIRPIAGPEELDLFNQLPYELNEELAADLAEGRRRPSWMWVALRGDRLLARAAWRGRANTDEPFLLDIFDVDDRDAQRHGADDGHDCRSDDGEVSGGDRGEINRADGDRGGTNGGGGDRGEIGGGDRGEIGGGDRGGLGAGAGDGDETGGGGGSGGGASRGDELVGNGTWGAEVGDGRLRGDPVRGEDVWDRVDIGVLLLRAAMAATIPPGSPMPEYSRFLEPGWRDDPTTRQAVEVRMAALGRTGAELFVERLRLERRPGTPVAGRSGRLGFRPVRDAEDLISLMTTVLDGTLDAHSRDDLTRMSARNAAVRQYEDELARYSSPRDWWRIATLPDGEPVGFVVPARNDYNAIIAYLAVVPAHRGHGYIEDILAEGTRILAAQDVPRIRASTDLGNIPMANAFRRAGYDNFQRELNMVWST
ncbi:GNAT family N-acetyltransferase [Micromonosporaceae bacterium Da 78-11]